MSVKVIPRDELKPKGLRGISDQQLEYHFETHYKGYVNKLNEIWEKLAMVDRTKANQNFSDYRALKVEETFNYMGVVLHELYFENMKDGMNTKASSKLVEMVEKNFGSWDKWKDDFRACGIAHRGWAVLVCDLSKRKLINNGLDAHNMYGLLNSIPLLVMDVYEHAYYTDQGPKRGPYIDSFFENVNWSVVSKRLDVALRTLESMK
ncbi:MAG TPA: superoxide dismutase [Candidatus Bathyarchaeia archaeon]|nr:superoxide dismutase [Candidatus Bathyarchaeia archaeon]